MDRIRLLQIIGDISTGGAENQLLGLLQRIDQDCFDVTVCYFHEVVHSMRKDFEATGARVIMIDKYAVPPWQFFQQLRRTIKQLAPDIVHAWLVSARSWGCSAALTCGVPCILASYRSVVHSASLAVRISERLLGGRTTRIANSIAVARSLQRYYGLPVKDTRVIYNAVWVQQCDRQAARNEIRSELALPEDHKLVVMVGRQVPEKNYLMFVRTAAHLCQQRPDVTFVSVGGFGEVEEPTALSVRLGVAERVRFVGQRDDVHRWLAAADAFCFTSRSEGFPNVVLEAMMAGVPVVCASFSSAREVIPNCEVGILVPCDDHVSMAQQVNALLEDEELGRRMVDAARQWVGARYQWDRLVDEMQSLYLEVCGRRG